MSGIDIRPLDKLTKQLASLDPLLRKEILKATYALAEEYLEHLVEHTPVDTGQLSESWHYTITEEKDDIAIQFYNTAKTDKGESYLEWVDKGHRLVIRGTYYGWVEGQEFIKGAEVSFKPKLEIWKKRVILNLKKIIENHLRG